MLGRLRARLPGTAHGARSGPAGGGTRHRRALCQAQTQILLGQPGYRRTDPDHLALMVGNHILGGGGFASRLTDAVREKRGLTYGVDSHFAPGLHAGAFTIGLQTRPDQADAALRLVRELLAQFVRKAPPRPNSRRPRPIWWAAFPCNWMATSSSSTL